MFFITCSCHFLAASAHAWAEASRFAITHCSSLSQAATDIWTIDSGISYTGSIDWRITDSRILSNTESTLPWMDDKGSSPCLKTGGTHRSRHSKSMDNTSLNRSDIFISTIGTYLSLFKCLVRLTTQRILDSASSIPPMPRYTYTDFVTISKSAILCNNFVSLLSDL